MEIEEIIKLVRLELEKAIRDWVPFQDKHEAYAHILEELDELWDAIKTDAPIEELRKEAIQVAAMAIRFCLDVPPEHKKPKFVGGESRMVIGKGLTNSKGEI